MMRLWHLLQRYRRYLKQALWIVPFTAIILEQVAYRVVHALDDWLGWQLQGFWPLAPKPYSRPSSQ